jgi:hypothetical protein
MISNSTEMSAMTGTFHACFARQGIHINSIHAKNIGKSP